MKKMRGGTNSNYTIIKLINDTLLLLLEVSSLLLKSG